MKHKPKQYLPKVVIPSENELRDLANKLNDNNPIRIGYVNLLPYPNYIVTKESIIKCKP